MVQTIHPRSLISILAWLLWGLSLTACEPKIVEVIPIVVIEEDLSIPGAGDIHHFTFIEPQIGFAAGKGPWVYRTTDGGATWQSIQVAEHGNVQQLGFFNATQGICQVNGFIYRTQDGGLTWSDRSLWQVDYVGVTPQGLGVEVDCFNFDCEVSISTNQGEWFLPIGSVSLHWESLHRIFLYDSLIVINNEDGYVPDFAFGLNLYSRESVQFPGSFGTPNDLYLSDSYMVTVEKDGFISGLEGNPRREYFRHNLEYHAVDGMGGRVICVGDHTIAANVDIGEEGIWHELFLAETNGFNNIFYNVQMLTDSTFLVSGDQGLLWKMRL